MGHKFINYSWEEYVKATELTIVKFLFKIRFQNFFINDSKVQLEKITINKFLNFYRNEPKTQLLGKLYIKSRKVPLSLLIISYLKIIQAFSVIFIKWIIENAEEVDKILLMFRTINPS